ncbi:VWA domain-containing protein [Bacillus sp. FSL W8-0102]|uniref:VWA domain-containing protein n=1 Tax=Bacillus sp. FSL W8-0102 TaxID=2978205 RepID=UPI0030FACDF3
MKVKNKKRLLFSFLVLFLAFVLTACGIKDQTSTDAKSEKSKETNKEETKKEEKAASEEEIQIATSIEEIVKEKKGKYSGNAYNEAVVHRALDEQNFQDKDSFQVYNQLLKLMNESKGYKEYYDFAENFNPHIETTLSKTPEGMKLDNGQVVNGTANIAILLDASGSMAQKIGGKTKMDLAKEAVNQFVSSMPEGANVSLRVYGHKGSNSDKDKKLSCGSTEVVYDLKPYNATDFKASLGKFQPTGWTPIALAITETKKDFEKANKPGQNIIYVVSDGIETCDGDPVKAAKELHDSNIKAVVNIIGFDVDSNGQKQLISVAEASGGEFETVDTAEDFKQVWDRERVRLFNEWSSWIAENWNDVSREQNEKENALYSNKSKFQNLIYDEKAHLTDAVYYLRDREQISPETRDEVESLIQQRRKILDEYIQEKYKSLIETVKTEGRKLKDAIDEKGEEMKDKYRK